MSDRIDELMRSLHENPRVADQSLIEQKLQALRTASTPKPSKPRDGKNGINGVDGAAGADGTNGIDGTAGADGANGNDGKDGKDGIDGMNGLDGATGEHGDAGMIWRGTYRSDIEYWIGDVVGVSGSAYVCVAATNQAPPVGFGWELLVSRGAQGVRGIKGEDGTGGGGPAAAGTLTGATLASNVISSNLESVGVLIGLTVTNAISGNIIGNAATATAATTAGTVTTAAQPTITSVGTLTAVNTSGVITGTNTTASTSSTTGAVIVAGGVGIAKDSFVNSVKAGIGFTSTSAIDVTNTTFGNAASDSATGTQCTAIGNRSLRGNTASNVTGIGYFSADGNSGSGLCAFGGFAGYSNSGSNVTAFGYSAAYDCAGNFNVAVGDSVLSSSCTGANNTGVGYQSARLIASGADNTCIGYVAGDLITTGSNNCVIGASADVAALGNTNSIVIGKSAVGLGSNTTVIGVAATTETKLFGQLTLDATALISAASATALALKTVVPAGTGVTPTIQVICPSSATALTSATGLQNVFSPAGFDTITVQAATTYMFDGFYLIKTTGTTTHTISMSFALTTATITNCTWTTLSYPVASTPTTQTRVQDANFFAGVTGGLVNATNSFAFNVVKFEGIMRVNAAGSVVPQITFSAAPGGTNTLEIGSYLRFYPIGSNSIDSVGTAIS